VQSATRAFPGSPASVGAARRFAAATLLSWRRTEVLDDVRWAVSELATNAALHAATDFTVTLTLTGGTLRMSVTDGSHRHPRIPRLDDPQSTTGRGLRMIAQLASGWGVEPQASGGKTVWCEFPAAAGPAGPETPGADEDRAEGRAGRGAREARESTSVPLRGTQGVAYGSASRHSRIRAAA
jgi:anti-sigma regulatory factor (Ser/Thr protein kinase)